MPKSQVLKFYAIACIGLISANRSEPFAPTKAQAMHDINHWRMLLRGVTCQH